MILAVWWKNFHRVGKTVFYVFKVSVGGEHFFFCKIYILKSILDTDPKVFGLLSECFWRGCQNCILGVCWKILKNFIVFGKLPFFAVYSGYWGRPLGLLAENFLQGYQNWLLRVRRNLLRKFFPKLPFVFEMISVIDQNCSAFRRLFWRRCQNSVLRVCKKIFKTILNFEGIDFFFFFGRLEKAFRSAGKNFPA